MTNTLMFKIVFTTLIGIIGIVVLILFVFNVRVESAGVCEHTETSLRCVEYVRTYDGDTFYVNLPNLPDIFGEEIGIRVKGIDTPEIRTRDICEKAKAYQARDVVKSILSGAKVIHLTNITRGKYFRIVADVDADGQDLVSVLMEKGLAYSYDGGTKPERNWCD